MSLNKVATAEVADWSFFEDPDVMGAVRAAVRKAVLRFEHIEKDDAEQDALLWLAVRPERVARAQLTCDFRQLGQDIYSGALKEPGLRESERRQLTDSIHESEDE